MRGATAALTLLPLVLALGGCSAVQSGPTSTALVEHDGAGGRDGERPRTGASPGQPRDAVIDVDARPRFASIVGASPEAVAALAQSLSERADGRGLEIAHSQDDNATHVVKGYFSAISEGDETTVIFVWDVLDGDGNRLHRIQGQQPASGGQGWSSVNEPTMEAIAERTLDELATWLAARPT